MDILQIEGFTHQMAPPSDWDEAKQGVCETLAIRLDVDAHGLPWMISEWKPSEKEIEGMKAGATIKLCIQGKSHPVVAMVVGEGQYE